MTIEEKINKINDFSYKTLLVSTYNPQYIKAANKLIDDFSPKVKPLEFIKEEFSYVAKTALGNYSIIQHKPNKCTCKLIQSRCIIWTCTDEQYLTFEECERLSNEHFQNAILTSLI